jgi:hypothetical protein
VGAAIAVGPLAAGLFVAPASATKTHRHAVKVLKPTKVSTSCSDSVSIAVAPGDTGVIPPVDSGRQYGSLKCGSLGSGVEVDDFALQDTGDLSGTNVQYFGKGTIHGTFDLTPDDNQQPSDPNAFATNSYTGTAKILGGTGAFANATGKGTFTCTTPDSIHMTCTEQVTLKIPPKK